MEKIRREYLNPGIPKYMTGVYEVYPPERYVHVLLKHALRYNPAGREFDSRWCHWNFSVT